MTPIRWLALEVILVLAIAAGSVMWASALMGSFDTYRSPFHGRTIAPGEPIGSPLTRRLVFVYVDGLRVDTAANAQVMPYLNELRARAAAATSHSREPSYSFPGYTTMMSGAWPEFNDGPLLNPDEEHAVTWPQDNLFTTAKRAGLKIGLADHYSAEKVIPQDALADRFYVRDQNDADDRAVTDAALRWLKDGTYQLVVVHLDQVDHTGHLHGVRSPRWNEAAGRVDVLLRDLGNALDLTKDTILITSDHGHIEQGGHGGHEELVTREPLILAGAGVKPGVYGDVEMVDIAPTVAALLGISIPALSQGFARTEMLEITPEQKTKIEQATLAQQQRWFAAYMASQGKVVSGVQTNDLRAIQVGVAEERNRQAASERWPRIAIAAVALIAILAAFWIARGQALLWQSIGALIYLSLFHAAYYFVEDRTYSLSSVLSAADIMSAGLGTAAVAFIIAAAVVLWRTNALRQGAMAAATTVLGTALVTMAIASIPALAGYAINGPAIDWAMPNFALMFFTFLTLLQLTGIGITSVFGAALSALAGWRLAR